MVATVADNGWVNGHGQRAEQAGALFVGRAREFGVVGELMNQAGRGRLRLVQLWGEPGIGKTTLAERLSVQASDRGWTVAWGRASNPAAVPPYWLWRQVIESLAKVPEVVATIDASTLGWLAELVPELRRRAGNPPRPPSLPTEQARPQLVAALIAAVRVVCADRPLMIVLDDLHEAQMSRIQAWARMRTAWDAVGASSARPILDGLRAGAGLAVAVGEVDQGLAQAPLQP